MGRYILSKRVFRPESQPCRQLPYLINIVLCCFFYFITRTACGKMFLVCLLVGWLVEKDCIDCLSMVGSGGCLEQLLARQGRARIYNISIVLVYICRENLLLYSFHFTL